MTTAAATTITTTAVTTTTTPVTKPVAAATTAAENVFFLLWLNPLKPLFLTLKSREAFSFQKSFNFFLSCTFFHRLI